MEFWEVKKNIADQANIFTGKKKAVFYCWSQ